MSGSMLGTAVGSAVVMLVGDKTQLGNEWYRSVVRQIEGTMIGEWHRHQPSQRAQVRGIG